MKLTKQDIQKIDNYLKKSIKFWDIRLEMIDHLASKLESTDKSIEINDTLLRKELGTPWDLSHKKLRPIKAQIGKKYKKAVYKSFFTAFTSFKYLPFILITIFIEYVLFRLFKSTTVWTISIITFFIFLAYIFHLTVKNSIISTDKNSKSFTQSMLNWNMVSPIFILNIRPLFEEIGIQFSKETNILLSLLFLVLSTIWIVEAYKIYAKNIKVHERVFEQYKSLNS